MVQQSKVFVAVVALIDLDGLLHSEHQRRQEPLLLEPSGKQMHPHPGDMRCELHERSGLRTGGTDEPVAGAAFGSIALPLGPSSIEMSNADLNTGRMLGEFVEHHLAGTLRSFFEPLPKHGELHGTEFSSRFKRWT